MTARPSKQQPGHQLAVCPELGTPAEHVEKYSQQLFRHYLVYNTRYTVVTNNCRKNKSTPYSRRAPHSFLGQIYLEFVWGSASGRGANVTHIPSTKTPSSPTLRYLLTDTGTHQSRMRQLKSRFQDVQPLTS